MKNEIYTMRDGYQVNIPIPTSYKGCATLVKSDYYRIYGHVDNIVKIWLKSLFRKEIKCLFWFRLASYRGVFFYPCLLMNFLCRVRYHCELLPGMRVGYGLYIGHVYSILVNARCVVGNNVNLSQFLNVGTNKEKQAIIGDNVYIGPMTCIVEDVHIGHDTTVGAGSVVTRDLAAGMTGVGVPCRAIGPNRHSEYVHNRWNIG